MNVFSFPDIIRPRKLTQLVIKLDTRDVVQKRIDRLMMDYLPNKMGGMLVSYSGNSPDGYISLVYYPNETDEEKLLELLRAFGISFTVVNRHTTKGRFGYYKFPRFGTVAGAIQI
jgi:hypothetical protein